MWELRRWNTCNSHFCIALLVSFLSFKRAFFLVFLCHHFSWLFCCFFSQKHSDATCFVGLVLKGLKRALYGLEFLFYEKWHAQTLTAKTSARTFFWMCSVPCEFHKWNTPSFHQDRARAHETHIPAWTERFFIASRLASALSHQFEIVWHVTLSHWGTHLEFSVLRCDAGWCDAGRIFEFSANVRGYAISECFDACWNWNVWAMRNCHW